MLIKIAPFLMIALAIALIVLLIRWRQKMMFFHSLMSVFAIVGLLSLSYMSIQEADERSHRHLLSFGYIDQAPASMSENALSEAQNQIFLDTLASFPRLKNLYAKLDPTQQAQLATYFINRFVAGILEPIKDPTEFLSYWRSQQVLSPKKDELQESHDLVLGAIEKQVQERLNINLFNAFAIYFAMQSVQGKQDIQIRSEQSDLYTKVLNDIRKFDRSYRLAFNQWARIDQNQEENIPHQSISFFICNHRQSPLVSITLGISGYYKENSTPFKITTDSSNFPNFVDLSKDLNLGAKSCEKIRWQGYFQIYDDYKARRYRATWQDGEEASLEFY